MGINDIYTDIIAEHSRSTRNKHHLENPTTTLRGVNPSCGDDITLELVEKDGKIQDASFTGVGCAISQASASIMIDLVKGKTPEEATRLAQLFFGMIKGDVTDEADLDALEEAQALQGIAHMPARVKCAVLSWHTLENALGAEQKSE